MIAVESHPAAAVDDPPSYHRTVSLNLELRRPAAAGDDISLSRIVSDMLVLPIFGLRRHHRSTKVSCELVFAMHRMLKEQTCVIKSAWSTPVELRP